MDGTGNLAKISQIQEDKSWVFYVESTHLNTHVRYDDRSQSMGRRRGQWEEAGEDNRECL